MWEVGKVVAGRGSLQKGGGFKLREYSLSVGVRCNPFLIGATNQNTNIFWRSGKMSSHPHPAIQLFKRAMTSTESEAGWQWGSPQKGCRGFVKRGSEDGETEGSSMGRSSESAIDGGAEVETGEFMERWAGCEDKGEGQVEDFRLVTMRSEGELGEWGSKTKNHSSIQIQTGRVDHKRAKLQSQSQTTLQPHMQLLPDTPPLLPAHRKPPTPLTNPSLRPHPPSPASPLPSPTNSSCQKLPLIKQQPPTTPPSPPNPQPLDSTPSHPTLSPTPPPSSLPTPPTKPLQNNYYKNRPHFLNWLRNESAKIKLSRQTYAGAVFLLDQHYKRASFNSAEFACLALACLVVSSKLNESKVLYTPKMAKSNRLDPLKLQDMELQILVGCGFRVNAYNYARIVMEYMRMWQDIGGGFFRQTVEDYLMFQEVFFLCEKQIMNNRELLRPTIRLIFKAVLGTYCEGKEEIRKIDGLFEKEENVFCRHEWRYVYECLTPQSEQYGKYLKGVEQKIMQWRVEFHLKRESLTNRFNTRCPSQLYGQFLSQQI